MTRLHAQNLTLGYGQVTIVGSLSAEIPDNQITTIIGPNGCGKSTLLKAFSRLLSPRGGAVVLDGQEIHSQPTKSVARRLGLLAQGSRAPEALTVEDLVRRGRYPHQSFFQPPTDADRLAVERALELANVQALRHRSVDELSGGQRQRAWIAMVLAQDTPILLLDEPTTYLDIAHQEEVLRLVRQLNRTEGKTVVMVLHDVNEAARASDHIIAMQDGSVIAAGSPQEVISPERLRQVFGVASDVVTQPETGQVICIPRGEAVVPARTTPPATTSQLRGEALKLGYGGHTVAENLTVSFPDGAVSAIVGANACGKSTLLRSLARLLAPHSGTPYLGERPVTSGSRRDFARQLSILVQAPISPSDVTIEELVASGRFPYQRWWKQWGAKDAQAVDDALRATALESMRYRSIDTLSGGQRQRAWVAMTLAQDTPVMLLDEPTTFLDIAQQVEVLDLVQRMNREHGRTVVMVLHDLQQACLYADHIIAMKDGQVLAQGAPAEVVNAAMVQDVFGLDCQILPDPVNGLPLVVPMSAERVPANPASRVTAAPTRIRVAEVA